VLWYVRIVILQPSLRKHVLVLKSGTDPEPVYNSETQDCTVATFVWRNHQQTMQLLWLIYRFTIKQWWDMEILYIIWWWCVGLKLFYCIYLKGQYGIGTNNLWTVQLLIYRHWFLKTVTYKCFITYLINCLNPCVVLRVKKLPATMFNSREKPLNYIFPTAQFIHCPHTRVNIGLYYTFAKMFIIFYWAIYVMTFPRVTPTL
jgi:hypothetical protein